MELVLGTVQFGLAYGVAGRGHPVPSPEVEAILDRAHALGVRTLDTAAAYGDIESRLLHLARGREFRVITKLPAVPATIRTADVIKWARDALFRAESHLGSCLDTVMFHRAEDLLESGGEVLWNACADWTNERGIRLGVSCYDEMTLGQVRKRVAVAVAQMPGNALDQRLSGSTSLVEKGGDVYLRSAFLQGLLLLPYEAAVARVPAAARALARWHAWLRDHSISALHAALALVKGLPGGHCIIGVDSSAQLEAVIAAWHEVPTMFAPELATNDLDIIDPRRWPVPI